MADVRTRPPPRPWVLIIFIFNNRSAKPLVNHHTHTRTLPPPIWVPYRAWVNLRYCLIYLEKTFPPAFSDVQFGEMGGRSVLKIIIDRQNIRRARSLRFPSPEKSTLSPDTTTSNRLYACTCRCDANFRFSSSYGIYDSFTGVLHV